MSRQARVSVSIWAAALGLAASCWAVGWAQGAGAQTPDALVRAHLEAGEFAPALALARAAPTREKQDAWLAQIAVAQARSGVRDAALRTAAEISDDRSRAAALAQLAAQPLGGFGGGNEPDFDSLIDLITSTIQPTTWDTVGGPGSVAPFPTGVWVDAQGVLAPLMKQEGSGRLAALHAASTAGPGREPGRQEDVRRRSPLRMVSLPRLERQLQLRLAAGRQPTEAMLVLAGLQRVKYVFVHPDSGDLILAGPAGDWRPDEENRIVSTETGGPVLRLDDLVVVLRHMLSGADARFGCLITPTQDGLARVQAFLKESQKGPIQPSQRKAWLEKLRASLGRQDIDIYGLDPRTRAARVLVEADYRMKLVGMGLEEGVPGVESYLASVKVPPGEAPPPMDVLRWWFTLNYDAVLAAPDRRAFEIRGQGVKVLSENELLTAEGKRVHTGKSEALNRQFAQGFTTHFEALCRKYPVYAELRNLCDLALVGAILRAEDLPGQVRWHMTCFGPSRTYAVEQGAAPKQVETVINHRVINRVHILAGVSGGVRVDPAPLVARGAMEVDRYGTLGSQRSAAVPQKTPLDVWWWD